MDSRLLCTSFFRHGEIRLCLTENKMPDRIRTMYLKYTRACKHISLRNSRHVLRGVITYRSPTASYLPTLLVLQRLIISITPADYYGVSRGELFFPAQSRCLSAANLRANHSADIDTAKSHSWLVITAHELKRIYVAVMSRPIFFYLYIHVGMM